jgi:hypothetical protein
MMKANWYVLGAVCLLLASVATAQLDDDGSPAGQSAGLPSEDVQPEVTIVERDDGVVYEYRVKGQLYMAKVVPTSGPSYYLLDTDGDGILDVQRSGTPDLAIPQWLLFSW